MKTEEEIRKKLNWYYSELHGVEIGTIETQIPLATRKYYLGAITAIKWVLGEN